MMSRSRLNPDLRISVLSVVVIDNPFLILCVETSCECGSGGPNWASELGESKRGRGTAFNSEVGSLRENLDRDLVFASPVEADAHQAHQVQTGQLPG
jgi:hypothetical protein